MRGFSFPTLRHCFRHLYVLKTLAGNQEGEGEREEEGGEGGGGEEVFALS